MNQPPPTETQTGKRIVSKGAYVKAQSKRVGMFLLSSTPILIAFSVLYAGGRLVYYSAHHRQHTHLGWFGLLFGLLMLLALLGAGCLILFVVTTEGARQGAILFGKARRFDPGVPLTRANTADLPTPDTLVRASEEPKHAQKTVLLRAVTEGQERHEEQLLRAAGQEYERK